MAEATCGYVRNMAAIGITETDWDTNSLRRHMLDMALGAQAKAHTHAHANNTTPTKAAATRPQGAPNAATPTRAALP
eukprot:7281393-Alexandrium_andersonii.AAC.1